MSDTESVPRPHARALAVRRPRLRLLYSAEHNPSTDRSYSLLPGTTRIGRRFPPSQDDREELLFAADRSVSELHAKITVSGDDYSVTVTDCGSKNGTFIESDRLRAHQAVALTDGQLLRVGSSILILRFEPAHAPDAEAPELIGVSLAARNLRARMAKLARIDDPVLVLGETGTGKEVVSGAIHRISGKPGALIRLNCAAIPASLAASELFGHAARSFNEAKERKGAFLNAHLGTLHLDEIGDIPEEIQPMLLRILESSTVQAVGADSAKPLSVRLITATNRDLRQDIADGLFREDLYHRIAVHVVHLPPLRERREDILPILLHHADSVIRNALTADLVQELLSHSWPGNVRELRSFASRLRVEDAETLCQELLSLRKRASVAVNPTLAVMTPEPTLRASPEPSEEEEPVGQRQGPYRLPVPPREELETLLIRSYGTVTDVAEALKCSRRQVQRWMAKYGLDADSYRRVPDR